MSFGWLWVAKQPLKAMKSHDTKLLKMKMHFPANLIRMWTFIKSTTVKAGNKKEIIHCTDSGGLLKSTVDKKVPLGLVKKYSTESIAFL